MHSRSGSVSPESAEKEALPLRRPRDCSSAAEPGCGRSGPGMRRRALPAPGAVTAKLCPPPAAVSAVTVGREEYRGKKSSLCPGERKGDLFVRRGGTGHSSREKTRVNLVLGAFQHPRGLQKRAHNTPKPT